MVCITTMSYRLLLAIEYHNNKLRQSGVGINGVILHTRSCYCFYSFFYIVCWWNCGEVHFRVNAWEWRHLLYFFIAARNFLLIVQYIHTDSKSGKRINASSRRKTYSFLINRSSLYDIFKHMNMSKIIHLLFIIYHLL